MQDPSAASVPGQDRRAMLDKVAAQLPGVIYQYMLRPDGTSSFPYSSEGIRAIYGLSPAEAAISAQPIIDRLHPDDLASVMASIAQSAEHLTLWTCEYRYCHPDGRILWLQGRSSPERLADGAILWHGFITDISDRKRTEQLLQANFNDAESYRRALDRNAIVSMTDPQGRITYVNNAFCDISGFTSEELVGRNHNIISSGVHPPAFWKAMWDQVLGGTAWHGVICNRRKDGRLYWVDSLIAPFKQVDGRLERIVSIRFDITAQKLLEAELDSERERLALALAGGNVGTWDWDVRSNTLLWDDRMYALYGTSSKEFSGAYAAWASRAMAFI